MKLLQKIPFFFILCFPAFLIAQNNNIAEHYVLDNYTLKNYTTKDGLPSNNITAITQDSIGYLWFSTNKGITRFDGNRFITFTEKDGLQSNKVNCIGIKNNTILTGTDRGLSIKNQDTFFNLESKPIRTIAVVKNSIFLGTSLGISLVRKDYIAPIRTNILVDTSIVYDISFDGEFFWVATSKGLWKTSDLTKENTIKRIAKGIFTSIFFNKSQVIATTYNRGILIIEGKKVTVTTSPKQINTIKKVGSQIWVATEKEGIEVLNNHCSFLRKINKYNTPITNNINSIFEDNQQNIWIATPNKGLYKFENDLNIIPPKSKIAFENINIVYQPLDSININGYSKILQLPSYKNHLSFTFKTINVNNPQKVEYRYKLNDAYSPWSKNNHINLANLKAGSYILTAQSRIDQEHESTPIQFQFFIDKPIYEKTWFQWLTIVIIALLVSFSAYFYVKKIKTEDNLKIEQLELKNHLLLLEQKALRLQMNPHFIFNVLNGIKALGSTGKSEELNTTISKFATLLRSILNNSRVHEISLAKEVATLKNYIELEQQISIKSFNYIIKTNMDLDTEEILIPPMLIQPFVENSIKHGIQLATENGEISVIFSIKKNFLNCTIKDNGIGFHQSKKTKSIRKHNSLAVKVTQERIENLAGNDSFYIDEILENNIVKGTKVWFKIPLKTDF
ncbi:sensor histidine kinase [Tenacibaculum maritimum]|uniref:sensor histidine kinase n=1 Tax=Tenacibaculum maritimum TaxID=107401 RepID=UPI0010A2FA03|nr:histidine kinase [Tenacibaculum maritimum]QCD61949.1 hypothetical protein B9C57_05030 [Tenacibaculum maritimum]CAA0154944.1 Two-component system sensor histidine kinase [Tenacibaculum maritimum]CAA0159151.1 Two-component system sensor histidine kinase [Tenacibaculum maritimum]CAA0177681.1 Two-component system sensor histidine kinase [Tenacibaculum maritimum]